jgi:hypothetical protein
MHFRVTRNLRGYESASTWTNLSYMDQNLRHRPTAPPKLVVALFNAWVLLVEIVR